MYANSQTPRSAQTGVHERLAESVARHLKTPYQKPVLDYNRSAFARSMAAWRAFAEPLVPLVLDAGCGTGASSVLLAQAFPRSFIIGVDQSLARLETAKGALPENLVLVRADLVDFWRLLAAEGVRLERHYLFYPNPWPKIGHLARRWHGHAVFPVLAELGGRLECRSNWHIYIDEFAFALSLLLERDIRGEPLDPEALVFPVSPFERKYRDSGQTLFRCVVNLE